MMTFQIVGMSLMAWENMNHSPCRRGPVFFHNVRPHDLHERENHDSLAKVKLNVQSFTGKDDPDAYIEWEERCDQTFRVHGFSEAKRVDLVIMEFSGYALTWWNQLQEDRFASGNEYVHSWTMMKES
jgi:hypothetical protein